jgi:hypothetical protein
MILYSNLPKLIARAKACDSVIDVGGWHNPFGPATHVIDLGSHATRQAADSLTPGEVERFSAETWTIHDVCTPPWPFEDNRFDFAICSHLLEDVRDPIAVCRELARVAKAGYIEVPSRAREIFAKARFFTLRAALGRMPEIGFYHHRWMVEGEGSALRFFRKSHQLAMDSDFFITRGELGRKMTENESGRCLWWEGDFTAEEVYEVEDEDLRAFKRQALARLKRG